MYRIEEKWEEERGSSDKIQVKSQEIEYESFVPKYGSEADDEASFLLLDFDREEE